MKSFSSICLKIAGSTMLASMILYAGEATAITQLFLGGEFPSGDPASDPAFADWLATAGLTSADVTNNVGSIAAGRTGAVYGSITDPGDTQSTNINIGGVNVLTSIAGWDGTQQTGRSGNAQLDGFGSGGNTMQAGSPRPAFANGDGAYIGTEQGSGSDGIRNAVEFDFAGFTGGGVFSFGVFGGDLETGLLSGTNANGSPSGFLQLTFADMTTQTIDYTPDASLLPATFDGNNNQSDAYGNRTSRFIGISGDQLISSALFVVGDDDLNDDADSEQLSFIAPMVFLSAAGDPVPIPTPALLPGLIGFGASILRKRRQTA